MSAESDLFEYFQTALYTAAMNVGWKGGDHTDTVMEFVDADGVKQSIGLEKFYSRFRDQDPNDWEVKITEYLQTVINLTKGPPSDDLNSQPEKILVRLGQPHPKQPPVSIWSRPLPKTDLAVMLVLREGSGLRFVREDMVEASGRSGDEWCEIGLQNLRKMTNDDVLEVIRDDYGLLVCSVGDSHDASRALLLDSMLPVPAPHGMLVVVPDRSKLLVLPLDAKSFKQGAFSMLKTFATNHFRESKYPISPEVFWVKDGIWYLFDIVIGAEGVTINYPPELEADFDVLVKLQ